jgi:putative transposase
MSLQVLKTPVRAPQANALRWDGQARCLDWMIPLNERHVRSVLAEWIPHYNSERPHSALGPGLPDDPARQTVLTGHRLPATHRVGASARLGGLHHHYQLELIAA